MNLHCKGPGPIFKIIYGGPIRHPARDGDFRFDDHRITGSTPVPCGMSRPAVLLVRNPFEGIADAIPSIRRGGRGKAGGAASPRSCRGSVSSRSGP